MSRTAALHTRLTESPVLGVIVVAAIYFLGGKLGLLLAIPPGYATALWPPSGIALGALLVLGKRAWPGVLLGSFLSNISTSLDPSSIPSLIQSIGIAAGMGAGAALQAWIGASLVRRFAGEHPLYLRNEREVGTFFGLGGPLSCLINASCSVGILYASGSIPGAAAAYTWWTWWVGDTIGVLVFAPLIVMWCSSDAGWRSRRIPITVSLGATLTAAVLVFIYSGNAEWADMKKAFERDATYFATSLERRLALTAENLRSTSTLFALDRPVSREDFMTFTEPMIATHPELSTLAWAPRVAAADRADFESQALARATRPYIWEQPGDKIAAAAPRSEYFPLLYWQTRRKFDLIGMDITSFPPARQAFQTARDSGLPVSTTPMSFGEGSGSADSFMIVRPIYAPGAATDDADRDEHLLGFVYASLHVSGLLDLGDGRELTSRRMHLTIIDPDAPADRAVLYRSFPAQKAELERTGLQSSVEVTVANRSWILRFTPTLEYVVGNHATVAWLVLAGGLILCALVGAGGLILTGRTSIVEALVHERTEELAQINGKLAEKICDHIHTEHELDREKQFLATVLENLNEGIMVFDRDGKITIENRAAKQIHTRITGQRHNRPSWTESHESFAQDGITPIAPDNLPRARALRGETLNDVQVIAIAKNRPPVTLMINAHPLRDRDGRQNGAIKVIHDITDIQKAERLKREFVSVVSHELRTPLTSIRGSLGLVNGGVTGELPPKARKLIEIAYRNTDRLSILINDILDMERIESERLALTMRPYSVADLLVQAVEAHHGYAEECKVQLALVESQLDVCINVDASRFQQVMANLLSNATKFSPTESVVEIGAEVRDESVRIFVRDYGPGIAKEFRPSMFQKFSQADASDTRAKSGTGLGLAISKGLIEKMNGKIDYETRPLGGSTFFIDLPIYIETMPEAFSATGSVLLNLRSA